MAFTYHTSGGPRYLEYTTLDSRIASFSTCPSVCTRLKNFGEFAKSGFFFAGMHNVICFYCGLVWERVVANDNPWMEHLIRSSRCTFVRLNQFPDRESGPPEWAPETEKSQAENYEAGNLFLLTCPFIN